MEVCQYSEATLDAAIKNFEGFGKLLKFKSSRDMDAIYNAKDRETYFEEMNRYNQTRLAHSVKFRTSCRLLRGHSGTEDVFDKKCDAVRPPILEKLQLETNVQDIIKLTGVTICPKVRGQGGKTIMGTLEAHVDRFRYKTSTVHPHIDVVYENIKCAFFRAGDHKIPPLLHLHLHNQIMLRTEETNSINFHFESTLVGQTNNKHNQDLEDFVEKVTDMWDSKPILTNSFESPEYEFHGSFPTKARAVFALTSRFLVELVETNPIVIQLNEIEIVNLAQLRSNEIDMTVVFQDFSRDVLQINSIPLESLAEIKHCLNYANVKYYQNERDLDWNEEVKKFRDSPEKFIMEGGWESLNLEAGDASDCFYWEEYGGLDEEDW